MSHFSKVNLILSGQPMCCTSGSDGCCLTCEENVLALQNRYTNYFCQGKIMEKAFFPLWAPIATDIP